jgi:hypothetical protein
MMDLGDDNQLEKAMSEKTSNDMNLLGVGIFGFKEELKTLTGKLSLWK